MKKKHKKVSKKEKEKLAEEDIKVKRRETCFLKLTKLELVHIRDMLSILYPSENKRTISQSLAEAEQRTFEESSLWNKISDLCVEFNLPVGDDAPDYAIMPIAHAPMAVFMLGQEEAMPTESKGFLKNENEVKE